MNGVYTWRLGEARPRLDPEMSAALILGPSTHGGKAKVCVVKLGRLLETIWRICCSAMSRLARLLKRLTSSESPTRAECGQNLEMAARRTAWDFKGAILRIKRELLYGDHNRNAVYIGIAALLVTVLAWLFPVRS